MPTLPVAAHCLARHGNQPLSLLPVTCTVRVSALHPRWGMLYTAFNLPLLCCCLSRGAGPDVGTLLDRLQKENSQIHSLRESVVLLERQLAAKSDEFTALQAKHVHLNDSERELREMLDAFRRDGYMRGSDGAVTLYMR